MARKAGSRSKSGASVKLTNRLAGAFVGLLVGGGLGAYAAQKIFVRMMHNTDSRLWVLTAAGCAIAGAIVGFFTAPADLEWNKPIEPRR